MKREEKTKLHQSKLPELKKQKSSLMAQLVTTKQLAKLGKETNLKLAKNLRYQIAFINTIITENKLNQKIEDQTK